MVTRGDECVVRLTAEGTGELFAECPVPKDQPLTTVRTPAPLHTLYTVCTANLLLGLHYKNLKQCCVYARRLHNI